MHGLLNVKFRQSLVGQSKCCTFQGYSAVFVSFETGHFPNVNEAFRHRIVTVSAVAEIGQKRCLWRQKPTNETHTSISVVIYDVAVSEYMTSIVR